MPEYKSMALMTMNIPLITGLGISRMNPPTLGRKAIMQGSTGRRIDCLSV